MAEIGEFRWKTQGLPPEFLRFLKIRTSKIKKEWNSMSKFEYVRLKHSKYTLLKKIKLFVLTYFGID